MFEALTRYNDNHYDDNLEVVGVILPVSKPKLLHNIIYSHIGFPLTPVTMVTMIILHIFRTNSIAFIVSRILLSLYYQVELRLIASMSRTVRQVNKILTAYA